MAASYEARARGVRGAMGGREARLLCPDAVVVEPRMAAYSEASRAVFAVFERTTPLVEGISIDEAFLDVGGLRRTAGAPAEIAAGLRRAGARRGGPRHHRRRGPHQVPRQGGERQRQARRPAGGAARRRDGVPPPAAGRAAVGRRAQDRGQAARPRARHRRRGGTPPPGRARGDARPGVRTAPPRPRPPPGPAPGAGWAAAEVDGRAERAAPRPPHARGGRRPPRRPRRPGDTPHADRRPGGPHRDAAAAVRRLHPRHPLAHPGRGDGPHRRRSSSRPATCSTPRSR